MIDVDFFVQLFFPGKNRKRLNCYIKVLLQTSWQLKYAFKNGIACHQISFYSEN